MLLITYMIEEILKNFYDYATNPNSELNNYKYSDIECEYNINDGNEVCNRDPTPILEILTKTQKLQFKYKFKILFESSAFRIRKTNYNFSMDEPNYPNYIITDLLEKKLQPYISITDGSNGHALVLQSWGIKYDKNGKQTHKNFTVFCYKNTWNSEYKMCYGDIKFLLCKNNTTKIKFFCLDYDLKIIKEKNIYLYNQIMNRRKLFFDTVNSRYEEEEMKYI